MKICLAFTTAALLCIGLASAASANVIVVGDSASGTGPYDLVSGTTGPGSYVEADLSSPIQFDNIASLSATFSDNLGGADGGSPRIFLGATNGDFFPVYLGGPPNFDQPSPTALTADFSGVNLNDGSNNSAFENSGTYQSLASLEASYGLDSINAVTFVVDGGWAANGPQDLTLDTLNINGTNELAQVPEPASLPLLLAGLGLVVGAMYFGRKKIAASKA